jgi:hypothetical protein
MSEELERLAGESIYDYEDRIVRHLCGDDACLLRTMNGAPWAMPCTLKKGHMGICVHDPFKLKVGNEKS